ncbi:MAG: hypothetical protein KJZ47_05355 [Gemmatimonadales bacterium]|nr:hypothetical protein [Gemmatimonadales bacterium]
MSRSPAAVVSKFVVLVGLGFVAPAPAAAQSYAVTVWNQLNAQYNRLNTDGYSSSKYIIGRLKNSETESWNITLYAGNTYQISGVCDGDCKDIDLALLDANRKELVNDTSADDVPVMSYAIRTTGVYTVKVTMYQCSQDPCYFGLGVFFK